MFPSLSLIDFCFCEIGRWTEEELFANVMVFEYAQAPLHVAFWLLYALSLHPEEEKKVVSEISNLLAEGPMTYERLPEFRYLTKVLSETLRLYPGMLLSKRKKIINLN